MKNFVFFAAFLSSVFLLGNEPPKMFVLSSKNINIGRLNQERNSLGRLTVLFKRTANSPKKIKITVSVGHLRPFIGWGTSKETLELNFKKAYNLRPTDEEIFQVDLIQEKINSNDIYAQAVIVDVIGPYIIKNSFWSQKDLKFYDAS